MSQSLRIPETTTVDGIKIFCREALQTTARPPCCCLTPGVLAYVRQLSLADRYHVIAPDIPVTGPEFKSFSRIFESFAS
jgi:hypothetical protein